MSFVNAALHAVPCLQPVPAYAPSADSAYELRGEIDLRLDLRHAGFRQVTLRYELLGEAGLPVVIVAGGISAHRHVVASATFPEHGWANALAQPGRALDPLRCRLLAIDYVGADGKLDVPLETSDQADAIVQLLDALKIEKLHAFVGYSYGALVGLQLGARHPTRLRKLIAVSGTHRAHPYASAWRALQRKAVALGQLQCADAQGLSRRRTQALRNRPIPGPGP